MTENTKKWFFCISIGLMAALAINGFVYRGQNPYFEDPLLAFVWEFCLAAGSALFVWHFILKRKKCPECSAKTQNAARSCKHCGYEFSKSKRSGSVPPAKADREEIADPDEGWVPQVRVTCVTCGKSMDERTQICPHCGWKHETKDAAEDVLPIPDRPPQPWKSPKGNP